MLVNSFYSFLNLTVVGSIVALVVLIIRFVFRKSIKKTAFVLLWVIVFLRLSIPFSVSSPTSVLNLFWHSNTHTIIGTIDVTSKLKKSNTNENGLASKISNNTSQKKITNNLRKISNKTGVTAPVKNEYPGERKLSAIEIFSGIWFAGIIFMMIFAIMLYLMTIRKMYPISRFESQEVENCKQKLKIRRNISVFKSGTVNSACALGILNPKIILSNNLCKSSNNNNTTHVLLHEMIHIKKFDNLVKLFCTIVLFLHWYNPLVWASYILMQKDIEASCDERVLNILGENSKKEYAYSLYEFASKETRVMNIGFTSFGETNTKFRIRNILNYKKTSVVTAVTTILVVSSVIVSCATNPFTKGTAPFFDSKAAYVTNNGLWYTRIDKSNPTLLVKGKNILQPLFSPDGNTIIFKQNDNLYKCNILSYKKQLIMPKVISYCFSKSGDVYASSVKNGVVEINPKNLKESTLIRPEKNTNYQNFNLSPNGNYLAFEKNIETTTKYSLLGTWLLDTKTKKAKVIVKSASDENNLMNSVRPINCKWSPDSKKLFVWSAFMAGSLSTDGVPSEIYDMTTGKLQRLDDKYGFGLYYKENVSFANNNSFGIISGGDRTMWISKTLGIVNYNKNMSYKKIQTPGLVPTNPSFSKDASVLLFAAVPSGTSDMGGKKAFDVLSKQQIYMYTKGKILKLTNDTKYHSTNPRFMVNGNYIMYTRVNNTTHKASIWVMDKNGKNQRMLGTDIFDEENSDFLGFYGRVDWNNVCTLYDNTK